MLGEKQSRRLPLLRGMHSGRPSLNLGQLSRAMPKTMLRAQFFFMDTIVRLDSMPCHFGVNFMTEGACRRTCGSRYELREVWGG